MQRLAAVLLTAALSLAVLWCGPRTFGQDSPKPGPEHALLKDLEGTWDATVQGEVEPGKKMESKAVATYKLACGGLWVVSDFKGEFAGMPFTGHGVDGYDPVKQKYTSVWVDSMSTTPLLLEGTYDKAGKKLTMAGDMTGPDRKTTRVQWVTHFKDKDTMVAVMSMGGPDGKMHEAMTITYGRRK